MNYKTIAETISNTGGDSFVYQTVINSVASSVYLSVEKIVRRFSVGIWGTPTDSVRNFVRMFVQEKLK